MRWSRMLGGLSAVLLCAVLAVAVWSPATSQDDYAERIADLETRVTLLEATVASLQSEQVAPSAPVLSGQITLVGGEDNAWERVGTGECTGIGRYDHLVTGGFVQVLGADDRVMAELPITAATVGGTGCLIIFEGEVPESPVYKVEVRSGDVVAYSADSLQTDDWSISITRVTG